MSGLVEIGAGTGAFVRGDAALFEPRGAPVAALEAAAAVARGGQVGTHGSCVRDLGTAVVRRLDGAPVVPVRRSDWPGREEEAVLRDLAAFTKRAGARHWGIWFKGVRRDGAPRLNEGGGTPRCRPKGRALPLAGALLGLEPIASTPTCRANEPPS